jgi:hypothetical protein
LIIFLSFKHSARPKEAPLHQKLLNLDLNGAILIAGCFSCFVLAMHWIGIESWTSARVVGSFVGFALLLLCFAANEWLMGDSAMVQAHIFKHKLVSANLCYIFFLAGAFFPLMYILPIQFQSVNHTSASQSGIRLIPLVMGVSVFTMVSNGLVTFWRHYKPWLLTGAIFATVGNVFIRSLEASTSTSIVIPLIANQAHVPAEDMSAATTMTLFAENCGTALFVACGEAAFTNGLLSGLKVNLPHLDAREVLHAGVTQIRSLFHAAELEGVLASYLHGCKTAHLIPVTCGAVAAAISLSNAGPATIKGIQMRLQKSHEI